MEHYAHTVPDGRGGTNPDRTTWQPLTAHLANVAEAAAHALSGTGLSGIARLAGERHDLGKFSEAFQRRLNACASVGGEDASSEGDRVDHSTAGASQMILDLYARYGEHLFEVPTPQLAVAFAIAFHHGGLRDRESLRSRMAKEVDRRQSGEPTLLDLALAGGVPDRLRTIPALPLPTLVAERPSGDARLRAFEFAIRMVFSALSDADFLDTEAHMNPRASKSRLDVPDDALASLRRSVDDFLDRKTEKAPPTPVNEVRRKVLDACRTAATNPPGLFTLSVPTGGGKTLSSLAFALRHAESHGLQRIIVVIPYTSIIDQTASVYRTWLKESGIANAEEWLIEHHSNLAVERDTVLNRLASENWDAPLIVTTTVQLFESLHGRTSAACRKLHRLTRSVVILDEVQTLPPALLQNCLDVLGYLVRDYGSTVVLCTATQPAIVDDVKKPGGIEKIEGLATLTGRAPIEINTAHAEHYHILNRRVRFQWRDATGRAERWNWEDLVCRAAAHPRALLVVNTRRDSRALYERFAAKGLPARHLSALLCPQHRRDELHRIRVALASNDRCVVVSTQLVEAGVDLDFPIVFRAVTGLDSIAQAAGRCNREGRRAEPGEVIVFEPTEGSRTSPTVSLAAEVTREQLSEETEPNLDDPAVFIRYFRHFYSRQSTEAKGIRALRAELAYEEVSATFRLIDDSFIEPVVVRYRGIDEALAAFRDESRRVRDRLRSLQPFVVNAPRRVVEGLQAMGAIEEIEFGVRLCAERLVLGSGRTVYDSVLGLCMDVDAERDAGAALIG
ncbi:MAG: CRISPR-associated helicase Cas3' [Planctomycetes bacterium]|nr:CRISPR-associated helicase Cas3' [Planctomycetota bacterium]